MNGKYIDANQYVAALCPCEDPTIAHDQGENRSLVLNLVEENGGSSFFAFRRILGFTSRDFGSVYLGAVSIEGCIMYRQHGSLVGWIRREMQRMRCLVSEMTVSHHTVESKSRPAVCLPPTSTTSALLIISGHARQPEQLLHARQRKSKKTHLR